MNYDDMSKEELINYINEMKKKRAFTYEDQMKLAFIDSSPFTLWASDRNCKIKFWSGKCESLYGYKKEEVLEKDFVDLFVAPDEQKAAREDQISIIDDAAIFHNIANDVGKSGNTLRLLTNCWRLKDPKTGEFWNAEMGLIIDFYNQEVERLEKIIDESRMLKLRVTEFVEYTKRCKIQFYERKRSINKAIRECDRKAVLLRKRTEFQKRIKGINNKLTQIEVNINNLIEEYLTKMKSCGSSSECETLIVDFKEKYEENLLEFEDLVTDFQEISLDYDNNGDVIHGKDAILKDTAVLHGRLFEKAYDMKNSIEKAIDEYKCLDNKLNSKFIDEYVDYRDQVSSLIEKIHSIEEDTYEKVNTVKSQTEIAEIHKSVYKNYNNIEEKLDSINLSMIGENN